MVSSDISCYGLTELAGDLIWTEHFGSKSTQLTARAFSAADLGRVADVPLYLPANSQDSAPVIADGHMFVVEEVGTAKWRLVTWGL